MYTAFIDEVNPMVVAVGKGAVVIGDRVVVGSVVGGGTVGVVAGAGFGVAVGVCDDVGVGVGVINCSVGVAVGVGVGVGGDEWLNIH